MDENKRLTADGQTLKYTYMLHVYINKLLWLLFLYYESFLQKEEKTTRMSICMEAFTVFQCKICIYCVHGFENTIYAPLQINVIFYAAGNKVHYVR